MKYVKYEKMNSELLEELERLDKESMGESFASKYTIKSIFHAGIIFACLDEENKISGVAQILKKIENRAFHIFGIYIVPEQRGKSLGNEFLEYIMSELKKMGMEICDLTVDGENTAAVGLYEKHGFRVKKSVKNYYGKGNHRLIMEWCN